MRDGPTLSTEAKDMVSQPIIDQGIDNALWSIDDSKAQPLMVLMPFSSRNVGIILRNTFMMQFKNFFKRLTCKGL